MVPASIVILVGAAYFGITALIERHRIGKMQKQLDQQARIIADMQQDKDS